MAATPDKLWSTPIWWIEPILTSDPDVVVYRMSAWYSAGLLAKARAALDALGDQHKAFVVDFGEVTALTDTEAAIVADVAYRAHHQGVAVVISGAATSVRRALVRAGVNSESAEVVGSGARPEAAALLCGVPVTVPLIYVRR